MRRERRRRRRQPGGGGGRGGGDEARTRQKRRRCGFPDKMADGDYLAEPAAPPTCSPAPGILGLVVSQRQQRSESLGPVGFRNRNSQQGVRGPAPARRTRTVQLGAELPARARAAGPSSPRARRLSSPSRGGTEGSVLGDNLRRSPWRPGGCNETGAGAQALRPLLRTRWPPLNISRIEIAAPPTPAGAGAPLVPPPCPRGGPPPRPRGRWFSDARVHLLEGRTDKTRE